MAGRRLLAVFAHPDDEAYAAGGLLAYCAAKGAMVEVLCATRGEAGAAWEPSMIGAKGLAALRTMELTRACAALGVGEPRFLAWPDGGIPAMSLAVRGEAIAAHLERLAPQVVVTLGRDGAYGHADHVAVTDAVGAAVASCGSVVRLLHCQFPRGLFAPVHAAMRRLGVALADGVGTGALGIDPDRVHLRLPLDALPDARQAKLRAIAAHRSQRPSDDPRSFLRPGLIDPLLDEEWYTVAAGPPLATAGSSPSAGRLDPDPFAGM